jgi:hypothetical protein
MVTQTVAFARFDKIVNVTLHCLSLIATCLLLATIAADYADEIIAASFNTPLPS